MKGYVLADINRAEWRELPVPKVNPYGALVKPFVVSPCTTDVHLLQTLGIPWFKDKALGHEMAGVVAEVGSEVRDFRCGDRVVVSACLPNWRSMEAQAKRPKFADTSLYTMDNCERGGSFVELYYVFDADMTLAHIPESVTWAQAVLLTDMATTAFEGVGLLELGYGDNVVVLGVGPVGLMGVCAAVLNGAARIFGVGSRKVCFEVAREFGATDLIDYHDSDYTDRILELNGGPVDAVFIAGGPSSVIADALRMVRSGGVVSSVVGFFGEEICVIPNDVWGYGLVDKTLKTVQTPGGRLVLEKLCNLVEHGRLHPEKMITHEFHGMEKIADAMQLFIDKDRSLIKPIIYFD
jgi:isopropanol dehydrogenase (NADP+)